MSTVAYRTSPRGLLKNRQYAKGWAKDHPEKVKVSKHNQYMRHREARLRYVFERKYGITWEQRDALLVAQGGVCALCGSKDHKAKSRGWHTDHDKTKRKGEPGFIRGILCLSCNTGLGHFNHDPVLLEKAKQYL